MLKDIFKAFFKKPQAKTAREMYYIEITNQYKRATAFTEFMRQARRQGFVMKLIIEVDGIVCDSGAVILERKEGRDLEEYIANWFYGMGMKYAHEITEMAALWPELATMEAPVAAPTPETGSFSGDWEG